MKKIMSIHDEQTRQAVIRFIGAASITGALSVSITDKKPSRSLAQNSLYWSWVSTLSTETGHSKDEMHMELKRRLLLPLMLEYPERYTKAVDAHDMLQLFPAKWPTIAELISTTDLIVHHFAMYLNEIEAFAGNMGIRLPHPDDIYHEALGRMAA